MIAWRQWIRQIRSWQVNRPGQIRSAVALLSTANVGQERSPRFMEHLNLALKTHLGSSPNKAVLLVLLCLFTLVTPFIFEGRGIFVTDEGTYALMARSFADSFSLTVWNGYEQFPSPELVLTQTKVYEGRLVPQYPYLFAVLSYPVYWLAGFPGLIFLNAIAFVATVGLCFLIARKLFQDANLALNACLILILATYAWEYSQAAWPHALSMLFVAASVYFAAAALVQEDARKAALLGLAGGIVAGFGVGIRLDVVFVLPALVVPFIFMRPWRPWCALAVCLGTVPGLAVLTATNYAKFGVISPFAYAPNISGGLAHPRTYLPVVILGLTFLVVAWIISRPRKAGHSRTNPWIVAGGIVALGGLLSLSPVYWSMVTRTAEGTYQLLVDLSVRGLDFRAGGLSRGPGGGLVYIDSVKKALLQSCPYLVILVVPVAMLFRGGKRGLALGALLLTPAAFVAPYAFFNWDGGLSLNLRYFAPILTFTSILAAFGWREVTRNLQDSWLGAGVISAGVTIALYAMFAIIGPTLLWEPLTIAQQEFVYLTLPLAFAVCALALVLAHFIKPGAILRNALPAVLVIGFVWSGLVAFTYDYQRANWYRMDQGTVSQTLARAIETDSLVFVAGRHYFSALPKDRRVAVAVPSRDDFEDFHSLAEFYLDRNRPVYVWITEPMEEKIRELQLFDSYAVVPVREHASGRLVRLLKIEGTQGPNVSG